MEHSGGGLSVLKQDIGKYYKGVIAAIVYCMVTHFLLGKACPVVLVTGFPCPGCGLTRAGIALLTLHWKEAWQLNGVIFLIAAFFIYFVLCRYILQCRCRGKAVFLVLIVLCLLVLYGYRMTHLFPSSAPMEYYTPNLLSNLMQGVVQK